MWRIAIAILLFALPLCASADVRITEIMYDRDGSDADREWIEVHNDTNSAIDLSAWHFTEGGTDHRIEAFQGDDGTLPAGARAVIADQASRIQTEYPDTFDYLFDSSFSLNNTGEELILKNASDTEVFSVTYSSSQGGAGDGNSLQWNGSEWVGALPTPGAPFSDASQKDQTEKNKEKDTERDTNDTETDTTQDNDTNNDTESSDNVASTWPEQPGIDARIQTQSTRIVAGAPTAYTGEALGLEGEILTEGVRYAWGFGDGTREDGEEVTHHYEYPGKYVVALSAVVGEHSATDYFTQTVIPADISIRKGTQDGGVYIALKNNTGTRLNVSDWHIIAEGGRFEIPEPTMILPHTEVKFPSHVLNFTPRKDASITLIYPNGEIAARSKATSTGVSTASPQKQSSISQSSAQISAPDNSSPEVTSQGSGREANVISEKRSNQHTYRNTFTQTQAESSNENTKPTNTNRVLSEERTQPQKETAQSQRSTQTAQVLGNTDAENSLWWWVLGLIALLGIALAAVFMTHVQEGGEKESENASLPHADEFEITEDKE